MRRRRGTVLILFCLQLSYVIIGSGFVVLEKNGNFLAETN
jgi:hypothetical protein